MHPPPERGSTSANEPTLFSKIGDPSNKVSVYITQPTQANIPPHPLRTKPSCLQIRPPRRRPIQPPPSPCQFVCSPSLPASSTSNKPPSSFTSWTKQHLYTSPLPSPSPSSPPPPPSSSSSLLFSLQKSNLCRSTPSPPLPSLQAPPLNHGAQHSFT